MQSALRSCRLRSAVGPTALIRRSYIPVSRTVTQGPAAYRVITTKPVICIHRKPFSMSSSAEQQPASTSATAEVPAAEAAGSSAAAAKTEPALPPLSPQEFRAYNRLAETMEYFVCGDRCY
jgi:hypothetical protein